MGAASVSVNVHVYGHTAVKVRQGATGRLVWLEVGDAAGSIGVFLDRPGLERMREALSELSDRTPAPDLTAAA